MTLLIAESDLFRLLEKVDSDMLGAIGIVTVVMFFIFVTASVITISQVIQNISLSRMQREMVKEMLAKGYSVEEITSLIHGNRKSILSWFFDARNQKYVHTRPAPPVKPQI